MDTPAAPTRTSAARRDLLALASLGLLAFAAARRFDLFARLVAAARGLEGAGDDALLVTILALAFGLKVYAWRRWREARRESIARARVETQLRRERNFSDAVLETADSLILVLDRRGHIVRFNHTCEVLTGYHLADVSGQPFWEVLLPPEELVRVRGIFAELRAGCYPSAHESHWVARDGCARLIAWANTALLDETGTAEYIVATGIDITERHRVEENLRDSEARFRAIFDRAAIGIALADRGRRLLACNPAYERFTGYGEDELRGRPFPTVTHPDDAAADLALYRELIVGAREYYQIEKRYVRSDGQISWGRLTVSPVPADDGTPQYCVGMVEDITARKTAERERREAEYRLGANREHTARQELEIRWHHSGLSPRERRVVELIACGHTNAEIGRLLYIQPVTVKTHIHNASQKLGLTSGGREAVLDAARQRGLLAPEEANVHRPAAPHTTECLGPNAAGIDPSGGGK